MSDSVTVLIADDHALVRDMLRLRLIREGMNVLRAVGTAEEAAMFGASLHPDVAVLDIDMPGQSMFDVARTINDASPETRIIFLSGFVHDTYIEEALAVEASGYLTKSEPPEDVVAGIQKAARGATCFSDEVLDRIVVGDDGARLTEQRTRFDLLTERERELLTYVAQGLQQKQIARQAGISIKTVQTHIAHLMDKLAIHDRVELARFAIREGFVEP